MQRRAQRVPQLSFPELSGGGDVGGQVPETNGMSGGKVVIFRGKMKICLGNLVFFYDFSWGNGDVTTENGVVTTRHGNC